MKQSEANRIYLARKEFLRICSETSIQKIDADGDPCEHAGVCDCSDVEQYFSYSGCDICGGGAGAVYTTVSLTRADIKAKKFDSPLTHEICPACLCSIFNGDNTDLDCSVTDADVKPLRGMKS